ncbi:type 4a pilus biogenesis protein PilO [Actinoplanes sp. CA-030573]|uniref:type 4a pilus biogenesis protein PilO n=1 Tax=Actinoplanes sp. CA-030573 TaxID=3239898 RepID=UPI003D946E9A
MGIRRIDRLWLFGGLFAIIVIVAGAYLLAIKPVDAKKAEYQAQVGDAGIKLISLKRDLAKLQAQYKDRAKYAAALDTIKDRLPDNYDVPNFVRAVQASGIAVDVTVSGISVGQPTKVDTSSPVVGVMITLTASGTADNISKFLHRLQQTQSRAALINSINLSQSTGTDALTASIMLDVFCSANQTTCKAE